MESSSSFLFFTHACRPTSPLVIPHLKREEGKIPLSPFAFSTFEIRNRMERKGGGKEEMEPPNPSPSHLLFPLQKTVPLPPHVWREEERKEEEEEGDRNSFHCIVAVDRLQRSPRKNCLRFSAAFKILIPSWPLFYFPPRPLCRIPDSFNSGLTRTEGAVLGVVCYSRQKYLLPLWRMNLRDEKPVDHTKSREPLDYSDEG